MNDKKRSGRGLVCFLGWEESPLDLNLQESLSSLTPVNCGFEEACASQKGLFILHKSYQKEM